MIFPSTLEAGLKSGILTKSKYIQGSYIVFQTADDMFEFTEKYARPQECQQGTCSTAPVESVLIEGTKCFLLENKNNIQNWKAPCEYRWIGTEWEELPTPFFDVPSDGLLYGRRYNIESGEYEWYKIKLNEEAIDAINQTLLEHTEQIDNIENTKQNNLVSGENIKTFFGADILGSGDASPIATESQVGGIKSGTEITSENATTYEIKINSETGIGTVKIPPLTETTTPTELIEIIEQGGGLELDGGDMDTEETT